jgi:hypothetical protein
LHHSVIDCLPWLKFRWFLRAEQATNPHLDEIMAYAHPKGHTYKMHLFRKYLTEHNCRYINVTSLDCMLSIFNRYEWFLFNITDFQLGPSIVYLFRCSVLFKLTFFHMLTPLEKFHQRVVHRMYTTFWMQSFYLKEIKAGNIL